jgi:hypothetical protein
MSKYLNIFTAAATTLLSATVATAGDDPNLQTSDGKHLLRGSKVVPNMAVYHQGKVTRVVWLESGYGFNADQNCKLPVMVLPDGTVVPMGENVCGHALHGRLLEGILPAAIHAYGAIEAAKNLPADIVNVEGSTATAAGGTASATGGTATATGGNATATAEGGQGGNAHSYSVSHGGQQLQFQAQQQLQFVLAI